jgi:chromosome segregation ATPase
MGERLRERSADMAGEPPLVKAIRDLERAIGTLEDAVERRLEAEAQRADIDAEIHRHDTDRSRLAHALDTAEARAARLEEVNRHVSHRLVAAMETIRGVLARHGG